MSADGAIEVISQEAPTAWMRLPKFETRLADQILRNVRERNGASVEACQDSFTEGPLPETGRAE